MTTPLAFPWRHTSRTVTIAALVLLGVLTQSPKALVTTTVYYVSATTGSDGGSGTQAAPWATITHALNSVSGSVSDPVQIAVAAGTYTGSVTMEPYVALY